MLTFIELFIFVYNNGYIGKPEITWNVIKFDINEGVFRGYQLL